MEENNIPLPRLENVQLQLVLKVDITGANVCATGRSADYLRCGFKHIVRQQHYYLCFRINVCFHNSCFVPARLPVPALIIKVFLIN